MAKKRRRNPKNKFIVVLIVSIVSAFCIITSLSDKNRTDFVLPKLNIPDIPSLDFIYEYLEGLEGFTSQEEKTNAIEVLNTIDNAKLKIHMLDMGQADSILICAPNANILIDCGENNQGSQVLRYLKDQGVEKLDILIGTHPHSDHIGGMDTVINGIKVDKIILQKIPEEIIPTTSTYTDLLKAIANNNLAITQAKPDLEFDLGDGAKLTIMGPVADYSDLNNMSIVSKLVYKNTSFLFTGDMSEHAELGLVEEKTLNVDLIQVPHHGSAYSSTDIFLDAASPSIALISCGIDNSYGHPHREVIEKLQKRDVKIYRTDFMGAIVVSSNGEEISVTTSKQ